jgi:uncharacterized protein GlcG (DUF336 family)
MIKNTLLVTLLTSFVLASLSDVRAEDTKTFTRAEITKDAALKVVQAVIAEAEKRDEVIAVAVTDLGGHLIAFARMDAAKPAVVKIAIDKAYSSAIYRATTGKLQEISLPGEPAYGLQAVNRTITFQGGIPVHDKGVIVGGVGVSGAAAHIDEEIALAAVEQVFGKQDPEPKN